MQQLQALYLSGNQLSQLPNEIIQIATALQSLYLTANQLSQLPQSSVNCNSYNHST
ncbi:MAG: hypothetical protein R3B93_00970 [Bacteroidia bacterium]